jgi:hypothetical protein
MAEKRAASGRKSKEEAAKSTTRRPAKAAGVGTKTRRAGKAPVGEPNPEERWRMVAEAAYYIAEKRGFVGGDPAADWYEAEKQVAQFLQQAARPAKTSKRAGP